MPRPDRSSPAAPSATALAAALLAACLVCACNGDEASPPYGQADLAGTWDFVTLRVGAEPGWERGTASLDAAGAVTLVSYLDDQGTTDPGAQDAHVVAVDPATGDLSSRVGGVPVAFHGTLARQKDLFAAVSTPRAGTYALMIARRRGSASYSDGDLRGRTFALHALRIGGDGEWRYGKGSVSDQGVATLDSVAGPAGSVAPPAPDGATLTVDAEGFVSDGGGFLGFLTPDKAAVVAVHPDPRAPTATHQLTVLQLTGGTFAQSDLEGTWRADTIAGNVGPIWYHVTVEIGATGAGRYVQPFLDSAGGTQLPPGTTFALAPDGTMTQPGTNPSYRGTLASSGEFYVRTQTHGLPGRYGLAFVLRR